MKKYLLLSLAFLVPVAGLPVFSGILGFPVAPAILPLAVAQNTPNVIVTDIKKTDRGHKQSAEIVLNNLIRIKEIQVTREAGRTTVKFPAYISRKGRVYPQVKILSEELMDAITKTIETGEGTRVDALSGKTDFRINRFSPYRGKNSPLKVFASVVFNNALEIECKIMEGVSRKTGRPYKFVSWPSRKDDSSGRWLKQVEITQKHHRNKIEKALLNRYDNLKEYKTSDTSEEWE
ncbi:MAG: hypothetical protein ABIJ11_05575 [Elusimicrobiota bacterium]